jgi:serine/threonine-protein kinase
LPERPAHPSRSKKSFDFTQLLPRSNRCSEQRGSIKTNPQDELEEISMLRIDSAALARDPLSGTHYRAVKPIGRSECSEVYEALGPGGEPMAIKLLHPTQRDSQEATFRLLQEGRVLAALRHENLVPLREIGVTRDGRPFLAMPLIDGVTLRHHLDTRGPLPAARACDLLAGALEGLDVAHRNGVVHRDIKPGNLLLIPTAPFRPVRAMVLDFGIAKVTGSAAHRTAERIILGTPRYLAPEQILGGRVDARTDVYAMGLVLFESITGRGPFDLPASASTTAHMRAHLTDIPLRLADLTRVPAPLDRAVARALDKTPARRFPSAAAFAAAIRVAFAPQGRPAQSAAVPVRRTP